MPLLKSINWSNGSRCCNPQAKVWHRKLTSTPPNKYSSHPAQSKLKQLQQALSRANRIRMRLLESSFVHTSQFPDVLRIKPSATAATSSSPDLSFLRPPPMPFIPPPESQSLIARLRYRWRAWTRELRFYDRALDQYGKNLQEYESIARRLGDPLDSRTVGLLAIYSGWTPSDKRQRSKVQVPELSRRDFHVLVRTRAERTILPKIPFVLFVAARIPLLSRLVPPICRRPVDRTKRLHALCKRCAYGLKLRVDLYERDVIERHMPQRQNKYYTQRFLELWHYISYDGLAHRIVPWIPPAKLWVAREAASFAYYQEIVADTVLIVREGGFKKLSSEDLLDYCAKSVPPGFFHYLSRCFRTGANPASEAIKREMVPQLDIYAAELLNIDWTRYRPTSAGFLELYLRPFCGKV